MSRILNALLLLCISAFPVSAQPSPSYPDWKTIGTAKLSVLWFDVYQAELSSENGNYDDASSFKLTLTYLRDFEAEDLISETFKQMPKPISSEQLRNWQQALEKLWPDVAEQDQISFLKDEKGISHFYHNQNYLGQISEPQFAQKFAAIWLGKTSEYPKLAAQLKGEKP